MKVMGEQIEALQKQNGLLTKAIARRPLTETTQTKQDAELMAKVD
jgi:hypothetical protein